MTWQGVVHVLPDARKIVAWCDEFGSTVGARKLGSLGLEAFNKGNSPQKLEIDNLE